MNNIDPDGAQFKATFTLPACALGQQTVTLTDIFGQTSSNSATFTVNGPAAAPQITSISPPTWRAGSNGLFVPIKGTGFGCTPTVTTSDPSNVTFSSTTVPGPTGTITEIDLLVNVNVNAPTEPLNVFVTNNDGGAAASANVARQGSVANKSSKSLSGKTNSVAKNASPAFAGGGGPPATVQIVAEPDFTPQIMFLGNNIANNAVPQTVYVGQQIILTAQIPLANQGESIFSETWSTPDDPNNGQGGSFPQGTAIASYNDHTAAQPPQPSAAGGYVDQLQATFCSPSTLLDPTTCAYNTFYWIDQADNRTFTFTYKLLNGEQASATVTFNVKGPTQPAAAAVTGVTQIAVRLVRDQNGVVIERIPLLMFGDDTPANIGILFTTPALPNNAANEPVGHYMFIQLINSDVVTLINGAGPHTCTHKNFAGNPKPELDTTYPYALPANSDHTSDNPNVTLKPNFGYVNRAFAAKMYLMWDPALNANGTSGCAIATTVQNPDHTFTSTPSQCAGSIPIPVGSWDWSVTCEGINTLSNATGQQNTTWTRGCGNNTQAPPFQSGLSIPGWSVALAKGDVQCVP